MTYSKSKGFVQWVFGSSQAVCRQTACIQEGSTTIPTGSRVQVCPKCSLPWKGEDEIVCALVKVRGSPQSTTGISRLVLTTQGEQEPWSTNKIEIILIKTNEGLKIISAGSQR